MQAHVTPDEFLREIEKLIEDAAETDDWKPVALAFFVGTLVLGVFVLQRLRGAVLGPRDPLK